MKEFEVVYEKFDYFFTKQIERKYDYILAPDITEADRKSTRLNSSHT